MKILMMSKKLLNKKNLILRKKKKRKKKNLNPKKNINLFNRKSLKIKPLLIQMFPLNGSIIMSSMKKRNKMN